jgi:7,8-dihydropterin-6-yl-methyl-4-(beta-D-ribofuranosyl)aminobenzene 5'-phosphate synthase
MTPIVAVLKVTILSTMLAGDPGAGVGEWGFAALVEAGDKRLLVDTGARAETVLKNAAELRIDLSTVEELVLTHNHSDHTGGLITLRKEMRAKNQKALSKAHVARGILYPRPRDGEETGGLLPRKAEYEAMGGTFVEHDGPAEIFPGVWLTGPVPRSHPERNWSGSSRLLGPNGLVEDTIPEDASIVVNTPEGLVVVSGCGHAGIVNTLEYARKVVRDVPIVAALGGFHLFAAPDDRLDWTAERLKAMGLAHLVGAHCTGIDAVYRLRAKVGLDRKTAVVGAVGSTFTLGRGIDPLALAR